MNYDAKTLARLFFPKVDQFKRSLAGPQILVSIAKARDLIGFSPEYVVTVDS